MRIIDRIAKNLAIRSTNISRVFRGEKGVIITDERKEGLKQMRKAVRDISEILEIVDSIE